MNPYWTANRHTPQCDWQGELRHNVACQVNTPYMLYDKDTYLHERLRGSGAVMTIMTMKNYSILAPQWQVALIFMQTLSIISSTLCTHCTCFALGMQSLLCVMDGLAAFRPSIEQMLSDPIHGKQ